MGRAGDNHTKCNGFGFTELFYFLVACLQLKDLFAECAALGWVHISTGTYERPKAEKNCLLLRSEIENR